MSELSQQNFICLFNYKDGHLYWKVNSNRKVKAGQKAGSLDSKGRWRVGIKGKSYQAHRIIFCLHHGYMPNLIDHIDGNPLNNLIDNLRPANYSTNGFNRKININNTSGTKGLVWNKVANKWQAKVKVSGKNMYFGYYKHKEIGSIIIEMARHKLHGSFMRVA